MEAHGIEARRFRRDAPRVQPNNFSWRAAGASADSRFMHYDVVIVGGSLAGAASATLLLRECPDFGRGAGLWQGQKSSYHWLCFLSASR
jgi:hypothetical protein